MLLVNMCFPQRRASRGVSDDSHGGGDGSHGREDEGPNSSLGGIRISRSGRRGGKGDRCDGFRQPCGMAVLECIRHIKSCLSGGVSATIQNPSS